jgi:phospholipid-binding lipoprotein MlaA
MQSGLAPYRFLAGVALSLWIFALPAGADTVGEALPVPQSQPSAHEAKLEPQKTDEGTAETDDDTFDEGANDPLEPLNRLFFGINELLDFVILRPVAEIYRAIVPDPVRNGVTNVLDNLFAPVVFLNHILQGEPERATATLFRFLMNSTFGLGGLVDVTSEMGYPRYDTDFNQTLMTWGVETGPYLVLPLIGPSSFRGGIGFVGDYFADPLNLYLNNRHHRKHRYWLTVRYGSTIVSEREKVIETLDRLRENSFDMYVTMRSIRRQLEAHMAEKLKSMRTPKETQ